MTRALAGLRLLVVEDEFVLADELARALADAGGTIIGPFASGADALRALSEGGVDAAVLDVLLADDDVCVLATVLHAARVPFVLATAVEPHRVPAECEAAPLFAKPTDLQALVAMLGRMAVREAC